MGSGNSGPFKIGGISGQGGGRILPGAATAVGELILATGRLEVTNVAAGYPDHRPTKPYGSTLDTAFAAAGGGPGLQGAGDGTAIYHTINPNTAEILPVCPIAGGGGGWGAAGGAATAYNLDPALQIGGNIGGAGGKAIHTNGYAVTWLDGSTRAYGAVG